MYLYIISIQPIIILLNYFTSPSCISTGWYESLKFWVKFNPVIYDTLQESDVRGNGMWFTSIRAVTAGAVKKDVCLRRESDRFVPVTRCRYNPSLNSYLNCILFSIYNNIDNFLIKKIVKYLKMRVTSKWCKITNTRMECDCIFINWNLQFVH